MTGFDIRLSQPDSSHQAVVKHILHALPQWFGIEKSIVKYSEEAVSLPMVVIRHGGEIIGFCALKVHYDINCELFVLGILPQYRRFGLGSGMLSVAEQYCRDHGVPFMSVKTLSERSTDVHYMQTRRFYLKNGFRPFEELRELWDERNPCLYMIKTVK